MNIHEITIRYAQPDNASEAMAVGAKVHGLLAPFREALAEIAPDAEITDRITRVREPKAKPAAIVGE